MHALKKPILVLGLGLTGTATVRYLLAQGHRVVGVDRVRTTLIGSSVCEHPHFQFLAEADFVWVDGRFSCLVVSPGIPQTHAIYQQALNSGLEIVGDVELFARRCRQRVVGITGTNGKTTVTQCITHVLNQCGFNAHAIGNVGVPVAEWIDHPFDGIFVVELSSFQLETLSTPFLDVALLLNITPDHLDRYPSYEAYAREKYRIADLVKKGGECWVYQTCGDEWPHLHPSTCHTFGFSPKSDATINQGNIIFAENLEYILPLQYRDVRNHDVVNLIAVSTVARYFGIALKDFERAVQTFKKPAHRIEYVNTVQGVRYYDDSKGTNLDAVIQAVRSIEGEIILIAGGVDKGASYTAWVEPFRGKVTKIFAIGQAAEKIRRELSHFLPVEVCASLEESVLSASKSAAKGTNVLLSPGCSSYDMFKSYAHRGDEFQRIVNALEGVGVL